MPFDGRARATIVAALRPREVRLSPNWTHWEDEQKEIFIQCPDCLAMYPLDSR
jgi:hypothetical protein